MPEKAHEDPKSIVFETGWTLVAGSTWDFPEAKNNSHKPLKFNATFSNRSPKAVVSHFSVGPFQEHAPEVLFPGWKSWKFARDFFQVLAKAKNFFNHQTNPSKYNNRHSLCRVKEVSISDEWHDAFLWAPSCP